MRETPLDTQIMGMTRRKFMKTMAALGAVMGSHGLLTSCSSSSGTPISPSGPKETKTIYFDHLHLNANNHDFYLNVGTRRILLAETQDLHRQQARLSNAFLKEVPDINITHHAVDVLLPSNCPQLCHISYLPKGQPHNSTDWKLAGMYLHKPKSAIEQAFKMRKPGTYYSSKSKLYGGKFELASAPHHLAEDLLVTPYDTAAGIIFSFPECMSLDSDCAAYVSNIILSNCDDGAMAIHSQKSGWASYKPIIDPVSNQPYLKSDKTPVLMPVFTEATSSAMGSDIQVILPLLKDDPNLYANRSTTTTNAALKGKLSIYQNGVAGRKATLSSLKAGSSTPQYTLTDVCTGGGYTLDLDSVEPDGSNMVAKAIVTNSYVRHLGMYVRYLDSNSKPIPLSSIPASFFSQYGKDYFTLSGYDGVYDKFLKVIGTPLVIFGIPTGHASDDVKIPVPPQASKFQIIGSTLGHGDDQYNDLKVGITLTSVFDLAIPSLFLTMGAGSGFAGFKEMENVEMFIEGLEVFGDILSTIVEAFAYADYKAFAQLGINLGEKLLSNEKVATHLVSSLLVSIGAAELEDAIPFFGEAMNAIGCAACAAQIATTSAECLNSPWNYVKTVNLSHTISITINNDPLDPGGFPSTATYYVLTATCQLLDTNGNVLDSATPIQYRGAMPATTQTAPIVVNLTGVPYGGFISLAVGFYSDNNWLAGKGTLSAADNTLNSFSMTITEYKVPLDASTVYTHKEKTALDASGKHIWSATTRPPSQLSQCSQSAGQICEIENITNSNSFASVGYVWQGYGSSGQQKFFGNVSYTSNPEQGSIIVPNALRTVYDLMGDSKSQRNFYIDANYFVRQIRLDLNGRPVIDEPSSNRAWGRLNVSPDALLLTPNGKLISINRKLCKIEVLSLPQAATTDSQASLAATYSGKGAREGLLDAPVCATVTATGLLLILETGNNRVQAFDTGGGPVPIYSGQQPYAFSLKYSASEYTYLDMSSEYTGYVYLLCYKTINGMDAYFLDIYDPKGNFVSRTSNFSGAKISVSYWRDVFAANLEALRKPDNSFPAITEPTISRWIPSTP